MRLPRNRQDWRVEDKLRWAREFMALYEEKEGVV